MLTEIHPKLPMRNKTVTRSFYVGLLGFAETGTTDYPGYLMIEKDRIQLHFFEYPDLNPLENYGQVYIRTNSIEMLYTQWSALPSVIHPNGHLSLKPWNMLEFSVLDPDHNLLTFGMEPL